MSLTSKKFLEHVEYYPTYLQDRGYDVDAIAKAIADIQPADRNARHMKYRGKPLPRSKWFFVDSLENVPFYSYPGSQYSGIVKEYKTIQSNQIIWGLQHDIKEVFGDDTNHVIGTVYTGEKDYIDWHNDKTSTLDGKTAIYTLSFFQQRPLALRPNPTDENKNPAPVCEIPMEHGSLLKLDMDTNSKYQHAILKSKTTMGTRISVIFRGVSNRIPMSDVQKKVKRLKE